jgi:uncharacterized protein involved in type VI secretion and phage assembly
VVDVDASTMRIKAQVPSVLGDVASGWCVACVPYAGPNVGFAMLPEVGSGVWIEFEGGDPSFPIWVGGYWRAGEYPTQATADAKVIVTQAGSLVFDDQASSVTLADTSSDSLTLTGGASTVASQKGKIVADATGVTINDSSLVVT